MPSTSTPSAREEIIRRFASCLDRALVGDAEALPEGLADEVLAWMPEEPAAPVEAGDFYAVWAELTAVTQEVKLQSRSFKQLHDAVVPLLSLSERVDAAQAKTAEEIRRMAEQVGRTAREREVEVERRCRAESIDLVLDLRDRLERSLDAARLAQECLPAPTWLERLLRSRSRRSDPVEAVFAAMREGYALSLERIDDVLEKQHVRRIDCQEAPFDARLMQVVAVEVTDRVAEGAVLEVYRSGYEWRGEIHRLAHVKVAKRESAT